MTPVRSLRERMADGPVLGGEGYVFELERRGYVTSGAFVPEVVLDHPDAVVQLHREFLRAGSEVMMALTYYAHREKLRHVGREGDLEEMNRAAVRIANEVASEGDVLVAADICNTWCYDPADRSSRTIVREMYDEQLGWAVDEGVDFVVSETNDYLGEALIALEAIQATGLPAVVTLASVQAETTRDGHDYVEACKVLADAGADVVGFNCDRGPATMLPLVRRLRAAVDTPIAAQPVPYRTTADTPSFEGLLTRDGEGAFPLALEPHLLARDEMAAFALEARAIGVDYIGCCCGSSPAHLRAMAEALGRRPPASRHSPAMALHPMAGATVAPRADDFEAVWQLSRESS